eukprot:m.105611 g.105611  ORF g.105611 m.105611 type:complete len:1016 (-) comp8923_c0_seq1:250-3297(-)
MYVFGGDARPYGISTKVYRFSLDSRTWSVLPASGAPPFGSYGLSAAYSARRNSIVFYGGHRFSLLQSGSPIIIGDRTNMVTMFSLDSSTWTYLAPYQTDCSPSDPMCKSRMQATTVLHDDNLYVFGGNPFEHTSNRLCQSNDLFVYNLGCQIWLPDTNHALAWLPSRRTAHTAFLRNTSMYVIGGYNGMVLGDMYRYELPRSFCSQHSPMACQSDPLCAVVPNQTTCVSLADPRVNASATPLVCPATNCDLRVITDLLVLDDECGVCASGPCSYCPASGSCSPRATPETCSSGLTTTAGSCSQCAVHVSCADCASANCSWDTVRSVCSAGTRPTAIATCPAMCSSYTRCEDCSARPECFFCSSTRTCISVMAVTSEYSFGQCIRYQIGSGCTAGASCSSKTNCSSCLAASPLCGWCDGGGIRGTCSAGTAIGPGLYSTNNSVCLLAGRNGTNSTTNSSAVITPDGPISNWQFYSCADVDECALGLALCDANATCVNESPATVYGSKGYRCVCPPQYKLNSNGLTCDPVCDQVRCLHGKCVSPNVCSCSLGWTGANCSVDCGCNQHSTCSSGVGVCDACTGNTGGPGCSECLPDYFGNATAGGLCLTCAATCNGHSLTCIKSAQNTVKCVNCSGNTMGDLCDRCVPGYFLNTTIIVAARKAGMTPRAYVDGTAVNVTCNPCMCNNHASTCDADTGENCPCSDYTRSPDCSAAVGSCFSSQCSSCNPSITIGQQTLQLDGTPVNGQLCYAAVNDMTFLQSITGGSTQGFMIVPRFTNVDIRIILSLDQSSPAPVSYYITVSSNNVTVTPTGGLTVGSRAIASGTIFTRESILIASSSFDFHVTHFYVIIHSSAPSSLSSTYKATLLQPSVNIDLFVFFSVFFSSFFLFLAVVALAFKFRSVVQERQLQQTTIMQMEAMASRALASVSMLLHPPINGPRALAVVALAEAGHVPAKPVCVQPLRAPGVAVATYVIELPMQGTHRSLCVGSAVVVQADSGPRMRRPPPRPSSRRVSSSAV